MSYVETQRSDQVSDVSTEAASSDLRINNLVYQQPAALSLAVNRSLKRQFFQRSTYTGARSTTMICDWNSGTSSVNLSNSYLTFKVKLTGAGGSNANFASGSAYNIINELRIQSRSGTELERLQNANLWGRNDSLFNMSSEWLGTVGSNQGFGATRSGTFDIENVDTIKATRFVIPLAQLTTFFRPVDGQMLPPQIASGLHFEIVLEDFRTAFFQKVSGITGYEIEQIYFQLDCVDLTDDCQRTISDISARTGLEYTYNRIFTSQSQLPIGQLSLSQQIRKACSQANYVTTITLSQADKIDITKDSLASIPFNYTNFQYRLGSLYFPNQQLTSTDTEDVACEAYTITQSVYDKLRLMFDNGSVSFAVYKASLAVLSASFEKSQFLSISGLPVNNSRVLEVNAEYEAVSENLEVYSFLQYTAVVRTFLDNSAIAI
jgi:hypothetical protein